MVCRSALKAKRAYVDRLDARENVRFVWDSEVAEIAGEDEVTGLRLKDIRNGTVSELACSGVFPFIGVEPNTGFMPAALLAKSGHIKADDGGNTSDRRIFAAGAVRAGYGGNVVQAMSEGVSAAEAAVRLLAK